MKKYLAFTLLSLATIIAYPVITFISRFDCGFTFSTCYHSWLEPPFLFILLLFALIISYIVTIGQYKYQDSAKKIGIATSYLTIIGTTIYFMYHFFIYHFLHAKSPQVMSFNDLERVTPYHVQLGKLFYMVMLFINFMLLFLKPLNSDLRMRNFLITAIGFFITLLTG